MAIAVLPGIKKKQHQETFTYHHSIAILNGLQSVILTSSRLPGEENGTSGHLGFLDHPQDDSSCFPRLLLANHALGHLEKGNEEEQLNRVRVPKTCSTKTNSDDILGQPSLGEKN
jgi:hypothetical protein